MYIHMTRIHPHRQKISEAEFNLTKQFIDMLDLTVDNDYMIYESDNLFADDPLMCGTKVLGFAERYNSLSKVPKDFALFRPFRNEKHANIIIELFEQLELIDYDMMVVNDYEKDGKIKYTGWLIKDGKTIEGSYIRTSPSAAILKMSILAALLMDADEHHQYMDNLMIFLRKGDPNEKTERDETGV